MKNLLLCIALAFPLAMNASESENTSNLENTFLVNSVNSSHLSSLRYYREGFSRGVEEGGLWVQPFAQTMVEIKDERGEMDIRKGGVVIGVDRRLSPCAAFGFSIGYEEARLTMNAYKVRTGLKNILSNLYGTWESPYGFYVDTGVGLGALQYHHKTKSGASSQYRRYKFTPHVGVGRIVDLGMFCVEPYLSSDYITMSQRGDLRSESGLCLYKTIESANLSSTVKFNVSYLNKTPIKKKDVWHSKVRHQVATGVSFFCEYQRNFFVVLGYDLETGSQAQAHKANVSVGILI